MNWILTSLWVAVNGLRRERRSETEYVGCMKFVRTDLEDSCA